MALLATNRLSLAHGVAPYWPVAAGPLRRPRRSHRPLAARASSQNDRTGPQVLALPAEPPTSGPQRRAKPPGGGGGGNGDGEEEPPPGPSLGVLRMAALVTQYAGIPGTIAVLAGYFAHVDAFGGLFSGATVEDVLAGLRIFVPLLALDAVLMLPDYSMSDMQGVRSAASLFIGESAVMSADGLTGNSSGGKPATPGQVQQLVLRARLALEVVQTHLFRNNPSAGMSPVAEGSVILVASLANEMLYRAVVLTLLSGWLRDRFFEAGLDDTVVLSLFGGSTEVATSSLAQYAAVAAFGVLGAAGYMLKAWREVQAIKNIKIMTKDGKEAGEDGDAIKRQLISSVGTQHVVVYGVEGAREVIQVVTAGLAYVTTGNLAGSLAGTIVAEAWISWLQRFAAQRAYQRRRAMLTKWRERAEKVKAAMKAAVAARGLGAEAAAAAAGPTEAAPGSSAAAADNSGSGNSSNSGSSSSGSLSEGVVVEAPSAPVVVADEAGERTLQDWGQGVALPGEPAASPAHDASKDEGQHGRRSSDGEESASSSSSSSGSGDAARAPASGDHTTPFLAAVAAASGPTSSTPAATAATPAAAALLEDMLRSEEGRNHVRRFMAQTGQRAQGSGVTGDTAGAYIDELLQDPETRSKLVAELEAQLLAMAERERAEGNGQ